MATLELWQIIAISLCFIWSGFIRSGIGFGGGIFALPILLLIVNEPLFFLPAIAFQAIFFTFISSSSNLKNINWKYLFKALKIIIIPKLIAIYGLIVFPNQWVNTLIFLIVLVYSINYIRGHKNIVASPKINNLMLILGGYVSGTSLIGAPLMAAVFASNVGRSQYRDTLFALWFILSSIKLITLFSFGVDFQLNYQIWWLPMAAIGHFLGLKLHHKLEQMNEKSFYRILGVILLIVSLAGIWQNWGFK